MQEARAFISWSLVQDVLMLFLEVRVSGYIFYERILCGAA